MYESSAPIHEPSGVNIVPLELGHDTDVAAAMAQVVVLADSEAESVADKAELAYASFIDDEVIEGVDVVDPIDSGKAVETEAVSALDEMSDLVAVEKRYPLG